MNALQNNAQWLLRIALASVFLFHGFGKVANLSGFAEMMGLPLLAIIPVLLGAIVMVHAPRWSFAPAEGFPMGGMEFQVVLLLIATYFLIMGNAHSGNSG